MCRSRRELFVAILLATGLVVGCSGDDDASIATASRWTKLGYDLGSTYHNRLEKVLTVDNARELRPFWQLEARGQVYGSPVVVDDRVYITATGAVHALDVNRGLIVWENRDFGATSSLAFSKGTIYVHDNGSFLRALDAESGQEIWATRTDEHPLAAGTSSPVVFERYVVVGLSSNEIVRDGATFRGGVAAFDRDTGEQIWRDYTANPPHNGAAVWSTVSIDPEARVVFAGSGQNYTGEAGPNSDALFALDLDTGERLWTTQTVEGDVFTPINPGGPDADFGANPILFEAEIDGELRELVGAGQKNGMFWTLDRATGEAVWSRELGRGSPLTGGVLNNGGFDGERILVANSNPISGDATLYALNPSDGDVVWQRPVGGWVWAPIAVANGVGVVAADKDLIGFDAETGDDLFFLETEGTIACSPTIVEGRVHVGSGMQHIVGTSGRTFHVFALPDDLPPTQPSPTPSSGGEITFSAIYDDIFVNQGCNTPRCHGGDAGRLSTETRDQAYEQLVGVVSAGESCVGSGTARVASGHADESLLWLKIATRSPVCGQPMPISSSLSQGDIDRVRRWIEAGAPND